MQSVSLENGSEVSIGSRAEVEFEDGRRLKVTICSPQEVDPSNGCISYESPLGDALLGARPGETLTYQVNGRKITVKVISVA